MAKINHNTDSKTQIIPEDEIRFREEMAAPLSDADRDRFLALLDSPPAPNEALRQASAEYRKSREV
jgi:uncharacterized protein (DUF1778 family)